MVKNFDDLQQVGKENVDVTLKAMGAPNSYVYKVIMKQAAIAAVLGYVLGMIVSVLVVHGSQKGGAAILMPTSMVDSMSVALPAAMMAQGKIAGKET